VNLAIAALVRQAIQQLKQRSSVAAAPAIAKDEATNGRQAPALPASTGEDYTIVHSVPGRIRLRIPRLGSDALYAKRLHSLLSADERVKSVRVNRAAASLTIQYDGSGVSELELGLYLLHILEQAEQPSLMPTSSTPDPNTAP